jgi:hypothetical protein
MPLLALPSDLLSEGALIGRQSAKLAVVVGGPRPPTGTHWLDAPADVSSQNGSGQHLLDEGVSTRNRKSEES